MKALGPVVAVLGAAALAGAATAAEPIPIPPVPTTPTVTVPVPQVPVPPAPSVPPPPSVPSAPQAPTLPEPVGAVSSTGNVATGAVEQVVSSGSRAANSPAPSGSTCCSSGGRATGSTTSAGGPTVEHFDSSRPWIGTQGSKRRRTTTLTFVLPGAMRVLFTVNQVSPACAGVGHFTVRGHKGLNRVRFAGRLHGESLTPGTYRISARTPDGRVVRRITLVVIDGPAPTRNELQALRAANVCTADESTSSLAAANPSAPAAMGPAQLPSPESSGGLRVATPDAPDISGGVLATSVEKTARAVRPLLIALLAFAILLLALASTPQVALAGGRTNDLLARHRTEIAAVGAVALLATAATFLFG